MIKLRILRTLTKLYKGILRHHYTKERLYRKMSHRACSSSSGVGWMAIAGRLQTPQLQQQPTALTIVYVCALTDLYIDQCVRSEWRLPMYYRCSSTRGKVKLR